MKEFTVTYLITSKQESAVAKLAERLEISTEDCFRLTMKYGAPYKISDAIRIMNSIVSSPEKNRGTAC